MKLPVYDFCPTIVLEGKTFTENHRFKNNEIKCLDFVIVNSTITHDEIHIQTNYVFRKIDFNDQCKNMLDAQDYATIDLTIPIRIYCSEDYHNYQAAYQELFTCGKHLVLNKVSIGTESAYGRAFLWLEFNPIRTSRNIEFDVCRIRLYRYNLNAHGPITSALMWSLGAEVVELTDQQIEAEHKVYQLRREEEDRQHELRKAKQITPDKALEIIRLRDVENLSFAKIAKIFGVVPSTISRSYKLTKITK